MTYRQAVLLLMETYRQAVLGFKGNYRQAAFVFMGTYRQAVLLLMETYRQAVLGFKGNYRQAVLVFMGTYRHVNVGFTYHFRLVYRQHFLKLQGMALFKPNYSALKVRCNLNYRQCESAPFQPISCIYSSHLSFCNFQDR